MRPATSRHVFAVLCLVAAGCGSESTRVAAVKKTLLDRANDPASVSWVSVTETEAKAHNKPAVAVIARYREKNGLGALVLRERIYVFQESKVIGVGDYDPSVEVWVNVANAVGVTLDDWIGDRNKNASPKR